MKKYKRKSLEQRIEEQRKIVRSKRLRVAAPSTARTKAPNDMYRRGRRLPGSFEWKSK
jgi:hypothetical protein